MSRARKRRAASLTAEALWNIQMEDDSSGNYRNSTCGNRNIATREEDVKCTKNSANPVSSSTSQHPQISNFPQTLGEMSCVHNGAAHTCQNSQKVYKTKGKLTASVKPVIKEKTSRPHLVNDTKREVGNSIARNSQVLLLPISLDTAVSGIGRTVPVLTLHASPVNMDLMHCLSPSIINPIVTVSPLVGETCGKAHANDVSFPSARYNKTMTGIGKISLKNSRGTASYQTEPLNLKLGESTIPSSSTTKSNVCDTNKSHKKLIRNDNEKPWMSNRTAYGPVITNRTKFCQSKSMMEMKYSNKKNIEILSSHKFKNCRYGAKSPSSDSACSTDSDEIVLANRKLCKSQIKLRSKAAPPPTGGEQEILSRSPDIKTFHKIVKKRSLSEHSDSGNNGWQWEGLSYSAYVYSVESGKAVRRRCYPAMRRLSTSNESRSSISDSTECSDECEDDDLVMVRDCVMMRADGDEQAYIAKVAAMWEHPDTGCMMISLLWFYRPEHTEDSKVVGQLDRYNDKELFASRHLDEISVACVEEKCYVLTYYQFCRYHAAERKDTQAASLDSRNFIPSLPSTVAFPAKPHQKFGSNIDQSLVFFCRKFYDIKLHRLLKVFPPATALYSTT